MNGAFIRKPHFCIMKKCIPILLLMLVFASCNEPTSVEEQNQEPQDTTGAVSGRVQDLTLEIRGKPKSPSLYYQRAEAYLDENMLMLALDDVNRALSIDSTEAEYHALKGDIFYLNKDAESAVASYNRALELDPENTDALLKTAEIKLLLHQYQETFDFANRALRIDEQLYMAYFIKGYAHFELGDSSLFVSSVQTALELNPDFFDGYTLLASYYSSIGSDIALDYYNSALELRPESYEALYGKALHLQNTGRTEEAKELYEHMMSLNEENVLAWYNMGYVLLELEKEPEKAIPYFERVVEINPQYVDAIYNLGLSYEKIGQPETAIEHYSEALELDPQYDLAALGMERLH